MRILPILLLVPFALVAEDAVVSEPVSGGETLSMIQTILLAVITLVATGVAAWLRKKFKVENDQSQLDANKSLMEQRNFIIDNRLIPFAVSTGEHWILTQLPVLVKDATDGNGFDWKTHWRDLLKYLKTRVVQKFAAENIDIIRLLGEKELDDLLNRLAVKLVTKLPETLQGFIPKAVVDMLTKKASAFLVDKGSDLLGVSIE